MLEIKESENFVYIKDVATAKKIKKVILPLINEMNLQIIDNWTEMWGTQDPKKFLRQIAKFNQEGYYEIKLLCKKRGEVWQSTLV